MPDEASVRRWLQAALDGGGFAAGQPAEIAVRLVDEDEGRQLNRQFRDSDRATNVLSFPSDASDDWPDDEGPMPLGDLLLCSPVVRREANEQGKVLVHHWAHMLVHGTLHLLGYEHDDDQAAAEMEGIEIRVLTAAGLPNPYAGDESGR